MVHKIEVQELLLNNQDHMSLDKMVPCSATSCYNDFDTNDILRRKRFELNSMGINTIIINLTKIRLMVRQHLHKMAT